MRGVLAKDPLQNLHLLHGGDPQRGFDPEPGQGGVLVVGVLPALPVREVAVPVGEAVQLRLHGLLPDFVDHFPKIPDAGGAERVREADVPVPIRVPEGFPAPRARGVLRVDPPGLQADQGGENLEGGTGGAPRLRQIRIVDFIAIRRGIVQDGGPVQRAEELRPIHFLENGRGGRCRGRGGGALRGRRLRRARGVLRKRRNFRRLQGFCGQGRFQGRPCARGQGQERNRQDEPQDSVCVVHVLALSSRSPPRREGRAVLRMGRVRASDGTPCR